MHRTLKILLPVLVLGIGALGTWVMIHNRRQVETQPPEILPPLVRIVEVRRRDVRLVVHAQGTVVPRTESSLVPEVTGRVIAISPSLASGGFFERGDTLLTIDPRDYELAVVQAHSAIARAERVLEHEEAEAEVARREWQDLGRGEPSPLVLRELQVAEARADLSSARAALERAERDLQRTRIRAPFAGRVRDEAVDVGQFVTRGIPVGTIYAVDYAEVRLPIPDDQIAFLDLPLDYRGEKEREPGPEVILRAVFAGKRHEWTGQIVRTEGEIDPRSRMVHAVARVEDPYGRGERRDRPPLAVGLFVEAEIRGRQFAGVVILPRTALRGRTEVLVVDPEDRLRFREVEVLRLQADEVVVGSGLEDGERVCVSALDAVVDGMRVRTVTDSNPGSPAGREAGAP